MKDRTELNYFNTTTMAYERTVHYSIKSVARQTGYSVRTIRTFIFEGVIDAYKPGRYWYIPAPCVEQLKERRKANARE